MAGSIEGDCDRIIDAKGLYVCPGFIDIHTHSDVTAIVYPGCDSTLRQGVTTHLVGNCGSSAAPLSEPFIDLWKTYWGNWMGALDIWHWRTFGEYLRFLEKEGVGHNIAALVGHGAVRCAVMGSDEGAPTSRQLKQMKDLVEDAMRSGAFGLSTGLVYPPGCFARTDEIIELCKIVARYHGIYTSHIRGERETITDAIKEAITIGEKSGVPVQLSHNCPKYGASGKTNETLGLVEDARKRGVDVTVDNDMHTDLEENLAAGLPQYLHKLETSDLVAHMRVPSNRQRIKREIIEDRLPAAGYSGLLRHERFDRIFLRYVPGQRQLEGKTIAQVAADRGADPFETYFDLLVEENDKAQAIFDYITEGDVKALLVHPLVMISSDGSTQSLEGPNNDPPAYVPCAYGEHVGIIERYVRDEPLLTLQECIRKMTSFPAQRIGLRDRGLLLPGMRADIALIDLARIKDRATNRWPHKYPFENYPPRYAEGVPFVIVNGKIAVDNGKQTKVRAGEVLRHRP